MKLNLVSLKSGVLKRMLRMLIIAAINYAYTPLYWSKTADPQQNENVCDNLMITGMYYVIVMVRNSCSEAKFQFL